MAKRAVDLAGDEQGAYVDTLARVFFARGDYADAVKQQTRAAELMPYNRAVQRQLVSFRKKAREKGIKLESIEKSEKPAKRTPPPTRERSGKTILLARQRGRGVFECGFVSGFSYGCVRQIATG